jgi:DNA-binding PadR family transcriptional regulator
VFERGDLKYAILRLLTRKPMHGYEVMQALEEESRGWYSASAGSVYPVLQLLQDQGYVTSVETDGRRVYDITDAGREFLEKHSDRADDVMDRVSEFAGRFASEAREMEGVARSFMKLAQEGLEQAMHAAGDPVIAARMREILDQAVEEMRAAARKAEEGAGAKGSGPAGEASAAGRERKAGSAGEGSGDTVGGKPIDEL